MQKAARGHQAEKEFQDGTNSGCETHKESGIPIGAA